MKFSESWLREWVNPSLSTSELAEQITMAGLEVDSVTNVAGQFSSVVVGEILSVELHPNAEKLRICQVNGAGPEPVTVVCGAANARAGLKVPFALVGAKLPEGLEIKKAKLRGVESCGMLCGASELQAGDDDGGLWELPADAPVGTDLREYLCLDDCIIDVDLTPNRGDCLSLKGIAREVAVLNRLSVTEPLVQKVPGSCEQQFPVTLDAGKACPRYVGRIIRNVDLSRPSPLWLREKLRCSGLRSIDAVVDITNYILLEQGQPMHAFDLAKLSDGITVRMADAEETLQLLDGQNVKLEPNTLVIADQKGPVAMAGIMGGLSTAVSQTTRDIFLESAFFDPLAIVGRARSYGLHTDSSHRFERGVDYANTHSALERATELLLEIVGGEAGPTVVTELEDQLPAAKTVTLRKVRIAENLGLNISDNDVVDILQRLGLTLEASSEESWSFRIPSYRFDITIEADLLEELARIYGYDRLPKCTLLSPTSFIPYGDGDIEADKLSAQLIARGYQEAITYSFIDPELQAVFDSETVPVQLKNPISMDMSVMRTSLLPGLVRALIYNLNRQQTRVRLYEVGQRFILGDEGLSKLKQEACLAGLIYGRRTPESWGSSADLCDFYDIKGDLQNLLDLTGQAEAYEWIEAQHPVFHPGQCAAIRWQGLAVGFVGALHPRIRAALDIPHPVYTFEILRKALSLAQIPSFKPLSKFPEVRRDLSVVIDQNINVDKILTEVSIKAGNYLKNLKVFDVYMGKGIDPHRKSVSLGLTFQHPSRTLTEDEINTSMGNVINCLEDDYSASLR